MRSGGITRQAVPRRIMWLQRRRRHIVRRSLRCGHLRICALQAPRRRPAVCQVLIGSRRRNRRPPQNNEVCFEIWRHFLATDAELLVEAPLLVRASLACPRGFGPGWMGRKRSCSKRIVAPLRLLARPPASSLLCCRSQCADFPESIAEAQSPWCDRGDDLPHNSPTRGAVVGGALHPVHRVEVRGPAETWQADHPSVARPRSAR